MTNQMNQMNRQQLFNLINTVSFAVDDLLLFLDTHPDDAEAIKAFHHYSDIRRNALQAYSDQYGPLTIDTADPCSHWNWFNSSSGISQKDISCFARLASSLL